MKAGSKTLKTHLMEYLKNREKTFNQRIELFIVGVDDDCVRVTDDFSFYIELYGKLVS